MLPAGCWVTVTTALRFQCRRKAPPVILDGDFNAALPLDTRITFTHDGKGRVLTREVGTRDHGGGGGGGARVISADIPVVDAREHLDSLD